MTGTLSEFDVQAILDRAETPLTHASALGRLLCLVDDYNALVREQRKERPDRERLMQMLDEDRDEVLMMLCDSCIDDGREAEAKGWGWLAANHKWPARMDSGWAWSETSSWVHENLSYMLPDALADLVWQAERGPVATTKTPRWPTARAALEAVVDVIASGKWQQ
jgi:hypothetical protein